MEAKQKQFYKQKLLELQTKLQQEEQAGQEATGTVQLDQSKVGRVSRIDALQTQAIHLETQRRRSLQLEEIKIALERINIDDYGYCLDCGEKLNTKRLDINPAVSFCIKCAEQREEN